MFRLLVLASAAALRPRPTTRLFAEPKTGPGIQVPRNVLGGDLECCCADVRGSGIGTGYYRDGHCSTGQDDEGRHTVCIEATAEFLEFSAAVGNDLSVPNPQWMFPGVMPGDQWCLCAVRYAQACQAGKQPKIHLARTHERTLDVVPLEVLMANGVDAAEAEAQVEKVDEQRQKIEGLFKNVVGGE